MKSQPSYYDLVYAVVRQVPRGRVTNYGAIADYIALGSSRMVGWALNNCHQMDNVPAHRVVNRKGELSGRHHFPTPTLMQELLESEGVRVENDCVVDFKRLFWHPSALGDNWEPLIKCRSAVTSCWGQRRPSNMRIKMCLVNIFKPNRCEPVTFAA